MSEKEIEKIKTWIDLSAVAFFHFDEENARRLQDHLDEPFKVVFDYSGKEHFMLVEAPADE